MKFRILMQHVNNISENKAQTIKFTSLGRQRRCVSQCLRICWGVCRLFWEPYWGAHASSQIERFDCVSFASGLAVVYLFCDACSQSWGSSQNKKKYAIPLNMPHGLLSWSIGFAQVYFAMLLLTNSSLLSCHVMPHSHDINPGPTANELLVWGSWVCGLVVVCPHEGKEQQHNMN